MCTCIALDTYTQPSSTCVMGVRKMAKSCYKCILVTTASLIRENVEIELLPWFYEMLFLVHDRLQVNLSFTIFFLLFSSANSEHARKQNTKGPENIVRNSGSIEGRQKGNTLVQVGFPCLWWFFREKLADGAGLPLFSLHLAKRKKKCEGEREREMAKSTKQKKRKFGKENLFTRKSDM